MIHIAQRMELFVTASDSGRLRLKPGLDKRDLSVSQITG